jgi:type III pantothenate kinase
MASEHTSRPVLLVVDAGNTQTHIGTFQGDELVQHWRFATVRESTADELGAALRNLLTLRGLSFDDIDASIVSSTVPQLRPEWTQMASRYLGHEMPVVGPGVRTGMPLRYDNPREIGPDRLVNAVAGYELVGGACVVVDFGTAVTFDVVSEKGEYEGGIIFPGVEISSKRSRTARPPCRRSTSAGRGPSSARPPSTPSGRAWCTASRRWSTG